MRQSIARLTGRAPAPTLRPVSPATEASPPALMRGHAVLQFLLLALALTDLLLRLDASIFGDHFFRQTHVAANIDWLLRDGPWQWPRTWNLDMPLRLYDFPYYQYLVAGLVQLNGSDPVVTAKLVNVAAFAAAFLLLRVSLYRFGLPPLAVTLALACFAAAPIVRFYFAAVHTDPLLLVLALGSLAAFLCRDGRWPRTATALWLSLAFLATLGKSPVFLPFALAMLLHRACSRGRRGLLRADLRLVAALLLLALLAFQVLAQLANGAPAAAWAWYFGSLAERQQWAAHADVLEDLGKQALPLAAAPALLLALPAGWRRHRAVLGWALAAALCCLLFLHVSRVHNYYLLPAAPALAAAAGLGLAALASLRPRPLGVAALVLLLAGVGWTSQQRLTRIAAASTAALQEAAGFVAANTDPQDLVLWVWPAADGNPAPHWFAQRQGLLVPPAKPDAATLRRWRQLATLQRGGVCCFVPANLREQARGLVDGWEPGASAPCGDLYIWFG